MPSTNRARHNNMDKLRNIHNKINKIKMQKTLGGDRLGSGQKMKVNLHGYERSTHDLGYIWRSTMAAGTLVPFMSEVALPGDTFDIDLDCDIKTHPTIGPLFGSHKVQLDVFQCPIRLYNSLLHNNALGIGLNMSVIKLPVLTLIASEIQADIQDLDNAQINPSCLLSYLGIRGIGITDEPLTEREFNAVPILAYWDIYKNYYANKQEEIGAVIHTPFTTIINTIDTIEATIAGVTTALDESPTTGSTPLMTGGIMQILFTGTQPLPDQIILNTIEHGEINLTAITETWNLFGVDALIATINLTGYWSFTVINWRYMSAYDLPQQPPKIETFELDKIDKMREMILSYNSKTTPFKIEDSTLRPYVWLSGNQGDYDLRGSQEGLALKTYQSDLLNNWLQTEWIDGTNGINEITKIDTSGGSFSIDTLNLSKKVYYMLNRIAVSGGTYDDWLDAVYDHERYQRCETPMYMGGLIKELVFQEVVSNSQSTDQPLGTLAGRGVLANKHKGGHIIIKVDEPSYIIGIISITPRLDYSQGNKWDTGLKTLDDLHKPALDEIGFQELITEQMAWWDTEWNGSSWQQRSAGKQPAWLNYMTNVNQTRGNFAIATNEMFMTLNRRYEPLTNSLNFRTIKDLTTYIDPSKFNNIFAETALDAQNFWAQIAVDITARRKMSAKLMPNL